MVEDTPWKFDNYSAGQKNSVSIETEGSLSCTQKPDTRPYPDLDESIHPIHTIPIWSVLILLPSALFLWDFETKIAYTNFVSTQYL